MKDKVMKPQAGSFVNLDEYYHFQKIDTSSPQGQRMYQDFLIFLLNMSVYRLFGVERQLMVHYSIGDGVFCKFINDAVDSELSDEVIARLKSEMFHIISEQIFIEKIPVPVEKAYDILEAFGRPDVIKNLDFHNKKYLQLYKADDYFDYYPRALPFNTDCDIRFDIVKVNDGFVLRFTPEKEFVLPKLLFSQFQEHDHWCKILDVQTVGDINRLINKHSVRDFILTEEALHEKKIAHLADSIFMRKTVKFVLIAGPSSSGKTTFAQRLAVQLSVNGFHCKVIGMDDYFLPRDRTPRPPNGEHDFESIKALDVPLLNDHLNCLLRGESVRLPRFNFFSGEREESNHILKLGDNDILIIEGIHGLNEELTASIPCENKVKIYISALNQLNIDYHNRIPTTDCRKIRRIVRDAQYRGYSAEQTLQRWHSIRAGEDTNIFPFQEQADFMFNSSLTYELGVMRKHVMPLLRSIHYKSSVYNDAHDLIALFEHFMDIKDELVPHNSILREFMSGSVFEY